MLGFQEEGAGVREGSFGTQVTCQIVAIQMDSR
jgi:hypothetical protein